MKAAVLVAVLVACALAGCSGGGGKKAPQQVILPDEITEQDIERLGELANRFPTAYSFPGQAVLAPLVEWINGTLSPGTGSGGVELPNDEGPVDYGADVEVFDLSSKVPVGQPVEVRINLKYWGDPGRAADADIWVDMPGDRGAYNPFQYDESNNWNIINKQRIVNSVHLEGQPFAVGLQVNNGRILDPSGVDYAMSVELHPVANVLAPGAPYAIQVPDNSTFIVIDTERVVGDEHVDVDFVVVDPQDQVVRSMHHNDIGQETLSIPVRGGGEYIVYAHRMHGGFLRMESELPNEFHEARLLQTTVEDRMLLESIPAPGTYAEGGTGTNTFGAEGTFDTGPTFPLDVIPLLQGEAGRVDAALNITGPKGWYTTAFVRGSYEDERGRIGPMPTVRIDRGALDRGTFGYGLVANGPGVDIGIRIVSYVR